MADDRDTPDSNQSTGNQGQRGQSNGTNARPLDDTIAGTGPGIADDALAPGEEMPEAPSDEEVARIADKLDAPVPDAS